MYWQIVELIYLLDILTFGYLFFYFIGVWRSAENKKNPISMMMLILTGALFFQEIYFSVNTLLDPMKLNVLPGLFPAISELWIYAKAVLTIAGFTIIYCVERVRRITEERPTGK